MKLLYSAALLSLLLPGAALAQGPARADSAHHVFARSSRPFQFVRYQWDVSVDASFVLPAMYSVTNVSTFGPPAGTAYTNGYANVFGPGYYGYTAGPSTFSANQARSARFLLRRNETIYNDANVAQRRGAYRFHATLGGGYESAKNDSATSRTPSVCWLLRASRASTAA